MKVNEETNYMNIPEETLAAWATGPGKTESERCLNAENAIKKAIKADEALSNLDITVFVQGSYRARTNVKQDSDVDICVRYNTTFFPDYPQNTTKEDFGNIDGTMDFFRFKNMVENALIEYFGQQAITRGNKAFDVHANTYRIDADVVPTFEHRRYMLNVNGTYHYLSGVAFRSDQGELIKNWPQQTYDNGVKRNDETGRKYKRVIRILKRLRNKMQEDNISDAHSVASFLIESLVWNAPIEAFSKVSYKDILRYVIADLFNRTRKNDECSEWGEVNELKYLFRTSQPWSRDQANNFLNAAWSYLGYT